MLHGETLHSALPQDIPWWMPDHAVFFGVFYGVLLAVGCGLAYVAYRTCKDAIKTGTSGH
jgi:hypothetical protein